MIIVKCEIVVVSSGGTLKADSEAAFRGKSLLSSLRHQYNLEP
jgi:hypothetical protein